MVLPTGAADEPLEALDGRTPLEAAKTPHIDSIATSGRQGCVATVPEGFLPGGDVTALSLFGYDPRVDHVGYGPLEAVARNIAASPDQLVFRCNLVTITDGAMEDYTAGRISQAEADQLITDLNEQFGDERCRFHAGASYRNLMIASNAGDIKPRCTPPHDIPDQPIAGHLPRGSGSDWVKRVMERSHAILAAHDVNLVRRDLGENPATDIWLWGYGRPRVLEPFASRFGLSGAVLTATDLIRGLARSIGMELWESPGATGRLDTDYAAIGAAAATAVDSFDLVVIHIQAMDEAGHRGDAGAKISAIEQIDEQIVGPLLDRLRSYDEWKILVAPDHPTPVKRRIHTSAPSPFCLAGHRVQPALSRSFSEAAAASSDLQVDPGYELMEYFLKW
jgi:2,3-bisphosphoglycerate-independent phosphoglycerate mutase